MRSLEGAINAFVAGAQGALVQNVSLQPDFSHKHCAGHERTTQRATVDQHFELEFFQIKIDPVKLAARERIAERLNRNHASRQTPIILMRRTCRCALFQRLPVSTNGSLADARIVSQTAEADVQLARAESGVAYLRQILQFEEDFRIRAVAVSMHD